MKEIFLDENFDVDEVTSQITAIMDRWSIQLLDINGPNWAIYDYDMEVKYLFQFQVDIHHIESLRDETTYRDNLTNSVFIK